MENNLHINEKLEKQKIAEFFAKRGTLDPDDKEKQNELVNGLIGELVMNTRFIAPVTLSGGEESREITFQMVKSPQGEQFFPVFTSSEDLEKWEGMKDSQTVQLTFDNYASMLSSNGNIGGIAINPFSDNFRVDKRLVAKWFEHKQMLVQGHANHTITNDTDYEVYALSPYPFQLSDKLCEQAKELPEVERIWLRGIKLDGNDGYLAIVDLNGDKKEVLTALGNSVRSYLNGLPIHFVVYAPGFAEQAVDKVLPIYSSKV